MIAGVSPNQLSQKPMDESRRKSWRYPATLFVRMDRDKTMAAWIEEDVKALRNQVSLIGIPPVGPWRP